MAPEAVRRADPDRPGQMGARAADGFLIGDDGGFHRLGAVGDALPRLGQEVPGLAAIKQFCGKLPFQPVDTPDHCGMIDSQLFRRGGDRSAAHDRQHETKIVPIDRSSTLILHFRTSIVQYIALVSYKMQVKRICKAI